jgi:adenylate cyclase
MTGFRHVFRLMPSDPRCQMCAAPFTGVGGSAMRLIGKRQSSANPRMCNSCEVHMKKHHGGAEIDAAMLFADIRGSTAMAERMSATEFKQVLDRFYTVASQVVFANGGIVDKFVGDELVAAFPPLLGARYVQRAVDAARGVLEATGHAEPDGPWVPVGAGVHSGRVWFGAVGQGSHTELTMLGDPMNTTARLAAQAEAGEILVSTVAAAEVRLAPNLVRRVLDLKGKAEGFEVVSMRVGPPALVS